jgi:hypothetical protein
MFSACPCAMSIRSKGSLCIPGSNPARTACSPEIANIWKPSRSTWPVKSAARPSAVGSFPSRTFVAISHAEAALTKTIFLVSAITLLAGRVNAASSEATKAARGCLTARALNASYHSGSSSEGRGSKNAAPTTSVSFIEPGWRLPATSPTGTRRTTGFDPRAMITSSPLAAF